MSGDEQCAAGRFVTAAALDTDEAVLNEIDAADGVAPADFVEQLNERNGSLEANIALIYVGLGDADGAISWLDKAYGDRFNPSIIVRPEFDPLRSDPRFKDLMRRLGLGTRSPM